MLWWLLNYGLIPAFLAFGQQFSLLMPVTWLTLPNSPCFVWPWAECFQGVCQWKCLKWNKRRAEDISGGEMLSLSLYIYLIVFHGIFPALCFWMSFPVPALLISDSRVLPMLWHSAAVGTASSRDTCPFQEHSGSQHVCLLNTWHTGNFVMYQTC